MGCSNFCENIRTTDRGPTLATSIASQAASCAAWIFSSIVVRKAASKDSSYSYNVPPSWKHSKLQCANVFWGVISNNHLWQMKLCHEVRWHFFCICRGATHASHASPHAHHARIHSVHGWCLICLICLICLMSKARVLPGASKNQAGFWLGCNPAAAGSTLWRLCSWQLQLGLAYIQKWTCSSWINHHQPYSSHADYISYYCWLVVGPPLWKIWKSIGMISNPIYGKIKLMATKPPSRLLHCHCCSHWWCS